jgi:hypothetical protein
MPSDDGLRLEDFHRVQHLGSQVIEPRKHPAIDIADDNPLGRPTPKHVKPMPKGENFGLQGCARPEQPATAYQINLRRSPIAVIIDRFAGDRQLFWVYGGTDPVAALFGAEVSTIEGGRSAAEENNS